MIRDMESITRRLSSGLLVEERPPTRNQIKTTKQKFIRESGGRKRMEERETEGGRTS